MNIFKQFFSSTESVDLKSIIEKETFLVDVRSPGEFAGGHVKGSTNIPLDTVPSQLAKFKDKKKGEYKPKFFLFKIYTSLLNFFELLFETGLA